MASGRTGLKKPSLPGVFAEKKATTKPTTCAQRIEAHTTKNYISQVPTSERQADDAEALFDAYKSEGTELLPRGALTELLRAVGFEAKLNDNFGATVRLAFDAHSSDSHFLTLVEFTQLYHVISQGYPGVLPRIPNLNITIMGAKGLPPADANGRSDPYCVCQVVGKPPTKSQTKVIDKCLDPWWGEEKCDKYRYVEGDSLMFEIYDYDKGEKSHDLLCKAILPSSEFHRAGGFDGRIPMDSTHKGYTPNLKVRVVVNGLPCPPPALKIIIESAKNLPHADANGLSDPFCTCMLVGKPYSKSQTKIKNKTLDPVWNEEVDDKYRYEEGDSLVFEVFDYDRGGKSEFLCKGHLASAMFHHPGGFEGDIPLEGGLADPNSLSSLHVKVCVNGLETS